MTESQPPPRFDLNHASPAEGIADEPLGLVIDSYLAFYAADDGHTARAKRLDVAAFLEFLRRLRKRSDVTEIQVRDWDFSSTQLFVDARLKLGEAPATVSRRLATLKHMGRVLAERLPGFINPARDVKPPKLQTARPKAIGSQELIEVRERASARRGEKDTFSRLRNETLLYLLLDTGLRAEEIRTLKLSQLDEQLEWIEKVRTKGRRYRNVYITSEMRGRLRTYLTARMTELRRAIPNLSDSRSRSFPLFVSIFGADSGDPGSFEMSPKSVWRAVRECTVDTRLHPHLLRHTYATELLDTSKDIRLVAQALGHSDVRVTMRYTERGAEEVAEALEKTRRNRKNR